MSKLTHLDDTGAARMVDVTSKAVTEREARAEATIRMAPETLDMIVEGEHPKGDVLAVARIAGIMAAKKTHELIPLCHALNLTSVKVELTPGKRWRFGSYPHSLQTLRPDRCRDGSTDGSQHCGPHPVRYVQGRRPWYGDRFGASAGEERRS